jgi:ribonucleoside-diphosphate reductase alpha chain
MGVRYGSAKSLEIASEVMQAITNSAYEASIGIAKEKGSFPLLEEAKYCRGKFVEQLPEEIRAGIKNFGLRNSHLISIAPTGTISLLAGNVSSGLEPIFAFKYNRRIRNGEEDDFSEVEVTDYAYRKYIEYVGRAVKDEDLPDYFVTTDDVTPEEHINIQAALQKYVDSSISKTINVPPDYPFDKFKDIYMYAHSKGLKGCTTFRPSEHITGVLTKTEDKKTPEVAAELGSAAIPRPVELEGTTYKIKTPLSPDALYLTVNDIIDDGHRRPYELFINTKNLQHFSWVVAMTRLISAVFRKEKDPSFLVEELKSIYDPNGGYFSDGKFVPSLAADIGLVIDKHLRKIGLIEERKKAASVETNELKNSMDSSKFMICPQCNDKGLYNAENCLKCILCGYSKCG